MSQYLRYGELDGGHYYRPESNVIQKEIVSILYHASIPGNYNPVPLIRQLQTVLLKSLRFTFTDSLLGLCPHPDETLGICRLYAEIPHTDNNEVLDSILPSLLGRLHDH